MSIKLLILPLFLISCQSFNPSRGQAKLVTDPSVKGSSPYFTLECREPQGCYAFAGERCPGHKYRLVHKETTPNHTWHMEFICEGNS